MRCRRTARHLRLPVRRFQQRPQRGAGRSELAAASCADPRGGGQAPAGNPAGRPGGDPGSAEPGLRRRLLRRHRGGEHRGAVIRPGAPRAHRAARRSTLRRPTDGSADQSGGRGIRQQLYSQVAAGSSSAGVGRRQRAGLGRRDVCTDDSGHRRHRLPAIHVGLDASARRCGDHPPRGDDQRAADDHFGGSGRGCAGSELVAAIPRHGPADADVPAVRRPDDTDVPTVFRASTRTLDQGIGRRLACGPHVWRRTEFRLRAGRRAWPTEGG
ncbi:Uncharacterised protein [Mycobacteroides abscessus subsp. massiliense]|nr:Uncharacterised protein [Mycobacteroides abscessus subsp. massiliense]